MQFTGPRDEMRAAYLVLGRRKLINVLRRAVEDHSLDGSWSIIQWDDTDADLVDTIEMICDEFGLRPSVGGVLIQKEG